MERLGEQEQKIRAKRQAIVIEMERWGKAEIGAAGQEKS
jgi:hypothetical protein